MSHALDNVHLRTVPEEFVAGPDVNSWESLGNPARPFEPGAIDSIGQTSPTTVQAPMTAIPSIPEQTSPKVLPAPQSAPGPGTPQENPVKPPKQEPVDDFLDPVNYEPPTRPEQRESATPISSKSIMQQRAERRTGRADL
jgi:hypothetical protein